MPALADRNDKDVPGMQVGGHADARFAEVRQIFERNLEDGSDVGAAVCIAIDGEPVVDLWGGWADEARTRPWVADTIVNVYSTTKTLAALVALVLADRGELDFDAPVARYWPEFAAAGKEGVTVGHLMSHSSGLHSWAEPMTVEDMYDWDKSTALLAAQAPRWEPGTASGYHGVSQGHLIGEVVRRITGQSLGTFLRKEIAEPLGSDFYIGLPTEQDDRCADLVAIPEGAYGDHAWPELMMDVIANPAGWNDVAVTRTRGWRGAELPATNGHGNARSTAEILSLLANGGRSKGKQILSEAGCRKALELQVEGVDLVLGVPIRFGLGFAIPGALLDVPNANTIFWGGMGGSLAIVDLDTRTVFTYVMNKMSTAMMGDERSLRMARAMWKAMSAAA